MYIKVFGETHFATSGIYNDIASLYLDMKKFESAEKYYLKSLEISQRFGNDFETSIT